MGEDPKLRHALRKPSVHSIPPSALIHLGQAMADGASKYGLMNWRQTTVRADVYFDAAMRHLLRWWDGEDRDRDSGLHHLAHAMASIAILLDAHECDVLDDTRPVAGVASDVIDRETKGAPEGTPDAKGD